MDRQRYLALKNENTGSKVKRRKDGTPVWHRLSKKREAAMFQAVKNYANLMVKNGYKPWDPIRISLVMLTCRAVDGDPIVMIEFIKEMLEEQKLPVFKEDKI